MKLKTTCRQNSTYDLFWQYPVITEKTFFNQNYRNNNFFGFPWATVHDKHYDLNTIYNHCKTLVNSSKTYYTCCQQIAFRRFIPIWEKLNINVVYTPHKVIGENKIGNIEIRPCPLYAVNIEDPTRNKLLKNINFLTRTRKYLYSFMGGHQPADYPGISRPTIFSMQHPPDTFVKHIGVWHFDKIVLSDKQNKYGHLNENSVSNKRTADYNQLLLDSRYSLCPRGSGPNSIRLWESLATGAIPIVFADTLDLPNHPLWKDAILRVKEDNIRQVPNILSTITEDREKEMRENCLKIYAHFKDNYKNE